MHTNRAIFSKIKEPFSFFQGTYFLLLKKGRQDPLPPPPQLVARLNQWSLISVWQDQGRSIIAITEHQNKQCYKCISKYIRKKSKKEIGFSGFWISIFRNWLQDLFLKPSLWIGRLRYRVTLMWGEVLL